MDIPGKKPPAQGVYPDANYGPLGEQHASYTKPRHYGTKADGDTQSRLIFWGVIITSLLAGALIAFMAIFGRGRYLN